MAYKRNSPTPVIEGGTGATTLTGVLIGNGTSAVGASTITQYGTVVAGASNTVSSVAPTATAGIPLVSNGAAANPSYTTAVVAGGGTGRTSLTAHDLLIGNNTTAVTLLAPSSTSGIPLVSQGASADPAYSTAVVSGGGTGVTTMTTAYAPVCAGTTATGPLQVASTGLSTSGFVLTSNGASALPSFKTLPATSITINGDSGSASGGTLTLTGGTSGAVFTGSGSTVTESFNFLELPFTDNAGNGQIKQNNLPVFHTYGSFNAFGGFSSGNFTLTGSYDTCYGTASGGALTGGIENTFLGYAAGGATNSGSQNVAVGTQSRVTNTTTSFNTAIGYKALQLVGTGVANTALGANSGIVYNGSESNNIVIANNGIVGDSGILRIGNGTTAKGFIAGIRGVTTDAADAIAVLISSTGQLGTVSSSIRYKENVEDMGNVSSPILDLRPVIFDFIDKPSHKKQIGLIAEEVEDIMPNLVVRDKDGQIESVKYHELPVLLLNELKKAIKRIEMLEEKLTR